MSQIELNPGNCWRCGGTAKAFDGVNGRGNHVCCEHCGAESKHMPTTAQAVEWWNTRPLPSADRAEPVAWLVERHWPDRIEYLKMTGYGVNWVRDANEAMRLSRREDAEQMAAGAFDEDDVRVAEHMWPGESAPPPDKVEVTREALKLAKDLIDCIEQTSNNVWYIKADDPEMAVTEVYDAVEKARRVMGEYANADDQTSAADKVSANGEVR